MRMEERRERGRGEGMEEGREKAYGGVARVKPHGEEREEGAECAGKPRREGFSKQTERE